MGISRRIKAKIDYSDLSHNDFAVFVESIYDHLLKSPYFPKLPISLPVLRAKLDEYKSVSTAALDSKNARLKRNSLRANIAHMVEEAGHHVEAVADGDIVIFNSSGLEAIPTHRKPPEVLPPVGIKKLAHAANSGRVNVTLTPSYRKVKRYEVRVREADADTSEDSWRIESFVSANGPVTIDGLTPGKKYEFQARGMGTLGFNDWSDSKSLICI